MAENAGLIGLFNSIDKIVEVETLLTFILVFALIYAILQKTKVIGEGKKNFNLTVSLVLTLLTILPHVLGRVPPERDPVIIITTSLPILSIWIVAILGVMLLVGVFGEGVGLHTSSMQGFVALLSLVIVGFIFGSSAGWWNGFPAGLDFLNDSDTQAVLIIVAVFALVIYYITRDDESGNISFNPIKFARGFVRGD